MSVERTRSPRRVPSQAGHVRVMRYLSTRARAFSSFAFDRAFSTVATALKYVKSSSVPPVLVATTMWRFSAGPSYTIAFSVSVRSRKGTFVRTPSSRATSFMSFHMRDPQGETAPSSMVRDSSGTRDARLTTRWTPVPSHTGHAPAELKAIASAPSP
ncbi:Uncharacterised protein [Mycobacteroides abscessus subsp. abscessus]|nr:Uncharacterised protein [Mycobacteroides abscessus subsp. abscessus]